MKDLVIPATVLLLFSGLSSIIAAYFTLPALRLADELQMFGETCYDMVFHGTMRAVQWWSKLVFISFTLIICGHILMSDSRHKAVVFIVLFMGAMACLFSHLLAIAAAAAAGKSAAYFYPRFGKRSLPLVMGSAFIGPIAVLLLAMAGAQAAAVAREREREIRDL